MTAYTIRVALDLPYAETVVRTRDALAEAGFGVLTEIDIAATLKAKLDVEVPAQVILGACRPPLAHAALQIDPAVATMLPCNVVVRSSAEGGSVVEAFDPAVMARIAPELAAVAADAGDRLRAALTALTEDARSSRSRAR